MKNIWYLVVLLSVLSFRSVCAIFNGTKAMKHQFPHLALIRGRGIYCAGALISDRHVLTAAHCLRKNTKDTPVKVYLGAQSYFGYHGADGELYYSKKIWMHENFSLPSAQFDIGLIELNGPTKITDDIKPIAVSTEEKADENPNNSEIIISGWGYVDYFQPARDLQYTKMKILPLKNCLKYKKHYVENLNDSHICALKTFGMPCDGDSGLPMVSAITNKVIGVLSYVKDAENGEDINRNDCETNVPVVGIRIENYIDWLSEKSGLNFFKNYDANIEVEN